MQDREQSIDEEIDMYEEEKIVLPPIKVNRWYTITKKKIGILLILLLVAGIIAFVVLGLIAYGLWGSNEGTCRTYEKIVEKEVFRQEGNFILKGVYLLQGDGSAHSSEKVDIKVEDGKIVEIGSSLSGENVITTYTDYIVTPGLVDMHSHLGVYSFWEGINAHNDGNEKTNPTLPQVRAIDAFNPDDLAIPQVRNRGGVTTVQILPGSANVMGGEAAYFKLRGGHPSVERWRIRNAPAGMKWACGENPKRVYKARGETPSSRMGSAWLMRQQLEAAQKLMYQQDQWDCTPENASEDYQKRPSKLALESLVRLLRNETVLNVHCYEVEDLEMILRLSKEFNFKVAAFHHALNAYKIGDEIRDANITVSTFADLFGYKMEAYDASVHSPKILTEAGVPVAMKSDHPVSHAKDLISHAAKSAYYGWDESLALASVMSVPAKAIQLDHRVGYAKKNYDADLVVWDRHPLDLGARPRAVFVEGEQLLDDSSKVRVSNRMTAARSNVQFTCSLDANKQTTQSDYVVTGLNTIYDGDNKIEGTNLAIVVQNGKVTCVGSSCGNPTSLATFAANGGIATPGFVEATSQVGMINIGAESSTNDGYATANQMQVKAIDGIKLRTRTARAAFLGGVTTSITGPSGTYVVAGHGVAFYTAYDVVDDGLIKENSDLRFNVGTHSKHLTDSDHSISGQFAHIRRELQTMNMANHTIVFHLYDAEEINSVIRLKKELDIKNVVITGAADAYLVADRLAEADIGVIVTPTEENRVAQQQFETRFSNDIFYADVLKKAGVRVGFGMGTVYNVRNLRWQAGMIREWSATDSAFKHTEEAIEAITSGIADMFDLPDGVGRIKVGTDANFNLFNGDPLSYEGKLNMIAVRDQIICSPTQF